MSARKPVQAPPSAATGQRETPQYRPAGNGRMVPVNDAARAECAAWNAYADTWNARTAARAKGATP